VLKKKHCLHATDHNIFIEIACKIMQKVQNPKQCMNMSPVFKISSFIHFTLYMCIFIYIHIHMCTCDMCIYYIFRKTDRWTERKALERNMPNVKSFFSFTIEILLCWRSAHRASNLYTTFHIHTKNLKSYIVFPVTIIAVT
jgi:hypothetical protein